MKSVRNWVSFLAAIVLVAFALPSVAAPQYTKLYTLTLTSSPSTPLTVVADLVNNALGPGNANIGSFRYTLTGATIASATSSPAIPATNIQVSGSSVTVTLPSPLKAGKHFILTIVLNDCGDLISLPLSGVQVWTGVMGQTFSPTNPSAYPLTASVSCAVVGCEGDPYNFAFTIPDTQNPQTIAGFRGKYDKDGAFFSAGCVAVPVTVTNKITATGQAHFSWSLDDNAGGDSAAAFQYTVTTVSGGVPAIGDIGVAWLQTNGSPTYLPGPGPAFITGNILGNSTALVCLSSDLPEPIGTFVSLTGPNPGPTPPAGTWNLTISYTGPAIVPVVPPGTFPILMFATGGVERFEVLDTTASPWVVNRQQANTTAQTFALGDIALSTPLPVLPISGVPYPYTNGDQAQMCIVSVVPSGSGAATTYDDIGDGWVGQP